jgi:uncharacterized membrane protein YedE/YeeE
MSEAIFPIAFSSEEYRLLTAIVLGFLFGFSLERAGFGNARKLVGQFYLHDMTVFKVMFTGILVAMVGLYSLASFGLVDLQMIWINPTFVWAQVVGGFVLGAGFIMSGLCPGTSVVSAASGRWDGVVTFLGVFVGVALFALTVDWFPGLSALYASGSLGIITLPDLLNVPAPLFALAVVTMAVVAFVGAEKVEHMFQERRRPAELTPRPRPRTKFALGGAFALAAVVAMTATTSRPDPGPTPMRAMEPLTLAEAIIARHPDLVIVDVRAATGGEVPAIPGALRAAFDSSAIRALSHAGPHSTVVVYDEQGAMTHAPKAWPSGLAYHYLRGGFEAWESEVLTAVEMEGYDLERRAFVQRQNQIAAYFSGAAVETSVAAAPPPPIPTGGAKKKKKAGGC